MQISKLLIHIIHSYGKAKGDDDLFEHSPLEME